MILAIDARTGQTLRTLSDGALASDLSSLYWSESAAGGTKTIVHLTDLPTGRDIRSFTVEGDLRQAADPRSFSALAGDARIAKDGEHAFLMNVPYKLNGEWLTRIAVLNTRSGSVESSVELRGPNTYGFTAFAPDAHSVFLEQYGEGKTLTRVLDLASGALLDPTGPGLATGGFRTAAVLSPDGRWMFRVDSGQQTTNCTSTDGPSCVPNGTPPYVVALDLAARRSTVIPLPAVQASSDFEKYMLWSTAITADGATLYAVNPALGVVDEIDTHALTLRRNSLITVTREREDLLGAIVRFLLPVAEAKRYLVGGAVLSPDGRTLYAAGFMGLVVIDTDLLTTHAYWQRMNRQFDTLRLSPDGRRLYAMDNMTGKLVMFETGTGAILGEIALPYVAAILRIDAGP